MLNFVLCDDNLNILSKLENILNNLFIKHDYEANIAFKSDNPNDVLSYIKSNKVHVLISDIHLHASISGIELAEKVRKTNKSIYIIFTTGHLEYALLAYKVKTFDYIPKPFTIERIEETLTRLCNDIIGDSSQYLSLNNKNIIKQSDIQYIKKDGMKLVVHTDSGKYEAYTSFNKIEPCLPGNFVRCHKSYIANIDNIKDIETINNTIKFNNDKCYIGPKYKNNFMEVLNNYGNFSNHLDSTNNT